MSKKLTIELFVSKALNIHGNKYNYDKFIYVNNKNKGIIECYKHGIFLQTPAHHLSGKGCPKCKNEKLKLDRLWNKEEFIKKAIVVHGNKYSYNNFEYTGYHNKSKFKCRKHGDFYQTPNSHLHGKGCAKCGHTLGGVKNRLTTKEYIKRAKEVHGNLYNYTKTIYIKATLKCCIICSVHGEFWQAPFHHLNGTGCPSCKASKGELTIKTILDKYHIHYIQEYKIPEVRKHYNKEYEYDFYLSECNLLIEFHGIQHYQYNNFFHRTKEDFEYQIIKDAKKREYAKAWGYKYLEIKYILLEEQSKEVFEKQLMRYIRNMINRSTKGR